MNKFLALLLGVTLTLPFASRADDSKQPKATNTGSQQGSQKSVNKAEAGAAVGRGMDAGPLPPQVQVPPTHRFLGGGGASGQKPTKD